MTKFAKPVFFILLFLASMPASASRYSPPHDNCFYVQSVLSGTLEMYDMDQKTPINQVFPEKYTRIDFKFLKPLIEGKYYKDVKSYEKGQKEHGCELYYLNFQDGNFDIICTKHGYRSREKESSDLTPYDQLKKLCQDHNDDIKKFDFNIQKEAYSPIHGLKIVRYAANLWPAAFILTLALFFLNLKRIKNVSWGAKLYVLASHIASTICVLSIINIYYVRDAIPGWRRFTYGSYPEGAQILAGLTLFVLAIWWLSSFFGLWVFKRNGMGYFIPLVALLITPVVVLAASVGPLYEFLNGLLPLHGGIMIYLLMSMKET